MLRCTGFVVLRGYRFVLRSTGAHPMVLCVSLGYRYFDIGGNPHRIAPAFLQVVFGATCYLKRTTRIGAIGSVFRIGGHAIVVAFRWAYRKIDLQYIFREMLKLLTGVSYISGAIGCCTHGLDLMVLRRVYK